jgi:PAS domain S-box-containing protein
MDNGFTHRQQAGSCAPAESAVSDPLPYIARAGEILAGSLDLDQTVARLLGLVIPALADLGAVHLLDDEGRLRRVAARYAGGGEGNVPAANTDYLDMAMQSGPVHRLIHDGTSFMSSPVSEADLDSILGPGHRRAMAEPLGMTSALLVPLTARGRALGVLALATTLQPVFQRAHQDLAEEIARRAALAIDSARLFQAASASQRAAERARERSAFVAEASATLAASLDIRTTLRTVVRLAVPSMVDSCTVILVDDAGRAHRVAAAHVDPAKQHLIDAQDPVLPLQRHPSHPVAVALATGQMVLDNAITDASLRQYASGQYLEYMRQSAVTARLVVPLEARERRIGALVLAMCGSGRTFDRDDVALGVELAGRAALAIDNARLYHDALVAREHLARSEERLRRALTAAGMVMWERSFVTGRTFRTDLAETLYGRPNAELADDPRSHLRLVHPEDRARMAEISNAAVGAGDGYQAEYRALWPDGTVRWLSGRARVFRDEQGQVSGMSGTTHDITDRKQAELALGQLLEERQAEAEELRQLHRRLQRSLEALLGIHEVGKLLISVSDLDAVGRRVLEIALRAARLKAAALRRRTPSGRLRLWQQAEDWAGTHPLWPTAAVRRARALTRATGQTASVPARRRPGSEAGALTVWCLPLVVKGETVGVLEAIGEARPPDEPTVEILGSIAVQASTALENARLYGEIASSERALHRLVQQLMQAQEDERGRLAYEIHDGFAQMVAGLQQLLEAYAHDCPAESEAARRRMDLAISLARRTVAEIRRVLGGLRPTVLDDFGLERGLRAYADGLAAGDLAVTFQSSLGSERFASSVEIALFRLAQEALTNVRRHAGVKAARLRLERTDTTLVLEVEDAGRGFDLTAPEQCDRAGEHMGLLSMRERIAQIGGTFELGSRCGMGTLIRAVVPVPGERQPPELQGADG